MSDVRAKFRVDHIDNAKYAWGEENSVFLSPVMSGSPENDAFWKSTPSGILKLIINNPDALARFSPEAEFYIDFTRVVPAVPTIDAFGNIKILSGY
jgi:hypothetical protein